jgi:hypothetical protein
LRRASTNKTQLEGFGRSRPSLLKQDADDPSAPEIWRKSFVAKKKLIT